MAVGTTLSQVVTILKSEIGASLSSGSADDAIFQQLIESRQSWFATQYDWAELQDDWSAVVTAGVGGRYVTIPAVDITGNTYSINRNRPFAVSTYYSAVWVPISFAVNEQEYNFRNSEAAPPDAQDPIMRWRYKPGDRTKVEIWPVPTVAQTIRWSGQRETNSLRTNGLLDSTKTLDIDDLLIALSIAVEWLTEKGSPRATLKAQMLQARWLSIRGNDERRDDEPIILGGNPYWRPRKRLIGVVGGGAGNVTALADSVDLAVAADTGSVVFDNALIRSPLSIDLQVSSPAAGQNIFATLVEGSLTINGFSYLLSAQPGTTGYKLYYSCIY